MDGTENESYRSSLHYPSDLLSHKIYGMWGARIHLQLFHRVPLFLLFRERRGGGLHQLTRRPSVSDSVRNDDAHCYADKKRVSCGGSRSSDSGCDVIVVTNWWLLFIWKYNKQNEFSGPRAAFWIISVRFELPISKAAAIDASNTVMTCMDSRYALILVFDNATVWSSEI